MTASEDNETDQESATKADDTDDEKEEKGPIEEIYEIIDRYYEGLKREKEGMGVD